MYTYLDIIKEQLVHMPPGPQVNFVCGVHIDIVHTRAHLDIYMYLVYLLECTRILIS
jgi:hypothetical protein